MVAWPTYAIQGVPELIVKNDRGGRSQ
jgi:hypothetical protein